MVDGLSGFLGKIADDLAKLKSPNGDVRRQLFNALRLAEHEAGSELRSPGTGGLARRRRAGNPRIKRRSIPRERSLSRCVL